MAKRADTSGLDPDFVISQAKPANRKRETELKPYDPSISVLKNEAEPVEETAGEPVAAEEVKPQKELQLPKEENKKRKSKAQEYETLFFKEAVIKTRNGKVVYIRKEHHERILKIVRVIGDNEFSLFNYLDNILENHFNTYQNEITELYSKKNTDIF